MHSLRYLALTQAMLRAAGRQWKTLGLTNTAAHGSYNQIGDWGIVADDEWHYTCIHLDHMMDNADDDDFVRVYLCFF